MTRKLPLKILLLFALLASLLLAFAGTASASKLPESTRQGLIQLQNILVTQEQLILAQQTELQNLKVYVTVLEQTLEQAESKLNLSSQELAALKEDLRKSSASIEKANKELMRLSSDMKAKTRTIKMQRNIWFVGFVVAGGYAVVK